MSKEIKQPIRKGSQKLPNAHTAKTQNDKIYKISKEKINIKDLQVEPTFSNSSSYIQVSNSKDSKTQ